jgi:signal transduction histidine kinase
LRLPRPTSLRQRLLLISTVVTLATLLIASTLFVAYDVRTLRGQMVRDLEVLAEVVGDNCLSALVFDVPETAEENLGSLNREYQIRYAVLYDADGRRFAEYRRDADQAPQDPTWEGEGVVLNVSMFGLGTVEVARALSLEGRPIGRIFIQAGMDELAAQVRRYAWIVAVLFVVALTVSLLLALRLQRQVSEPVLGLANRAREISARADYSLRAPAPQSQDEIADLVRSFNAMLEQIERRDRELHQVRARLEEANAQLRSLALEISLVGEQEKKRLAGELHDSPMQKLALAQAQITSAVRRRDRESYALLEVGLELVRDALQELRTLQFDLSPPVLYQEGLAAALEWLASNMSQRFGVAMTFVSGKAPINVGKDLSVVLFQCARELVHNVIRHADASVGSIELDTTGGEAVLVVRDNGKGLPGSGPLAELGEGRGYGLYSIRERVSLLGGELSMTSDAAGTRAMVRVPLAGPAGTLEQ